MYKITNKTRGRITIDNVIIDGYSTKLFNTVKNKDRLQYLVNNHMINYITINDNTINNINTIKKNQNKVSSKNVVIVKDNIGTTINNVSYIEKNNDTNINNKVVDTNKSLKNIKNTSKVQKNTSINQKSNDVDLNTKED